MSTDSHILTELNSDLDALEHISDDITDEHAVVQSFCKTLESAFRHGLLRDSKECCDFFDVVLALYNQQNTFGRPKGCTNALPVLICKAIDFICGAKSLFSSKGRGRLLFRCALNGQWIHVLLQCLQIWSDFSGYYSDQCLIKSNSEAFNLAITRIKSLSKFTLDLENLGFLDTTWERPIFCKFELVPCKDLGLMVCSIEGHIIVTKVKPYSVAGEDDKVEVGDNLVSIDKNMLFDLSPEFIARMIKKLGARVPISITVAKARTSKCKVYPPLESCLRIAGLDTKKLEHKWQTMDKWRQWRSYSCPTQELLAGLIEEQDNNQNDDDDDDEVFEIKSMKNYVLAKSGFPLTYLGSLAVGKVGDTSFLDWAIRKVMNDPAKVEHEVSLHMQELGIKLYSRTSAEEILKYPYPKISACGCNSTDPRYVAFISGDNLCRLAKNFLCHVFYTDNSNMAREIVGHMASGFERTVTTA